MQNLIFLKDARQMYEQLVVVSLIMRPSQEYKSFVHKVIQKINQTIDFGSTFEKSMVSWQSAKCN